MFGRIVTTIAIFLLVATGHAQNTWIKTYGGDHTDEGWDVQQTADGGYIIAGTTCSFGQGYSDVYLLKTDSNGDTLWTRTFGGIKSDAGHGVQQTADLGYIITGVLLFGDPVKCGAYMVKTDAAGDTSWIRVHRGDINAIGRSIQQTSDGGYVVAGRSMKLGGLLIKTDANGDTLWTKALRSDTLGDCYSVHQTADGGYILTGEKRGLAALVKTDTQGRLEWSKYFGAKRLDRGYSVRQTTDGGYVITGIQYVPGGFESDSRVFLVKTDASGDTLWTRKLGSKTSYGNCVRQTEDTGYIVTGYEDTFISLYKTDEQGYLLWKKLFYCGWGQSVRQTNDGGYIITGINYVTGKGGEVFLLKTDGNGNMTGKKNQYDKKELPQKFRLYQNSPNPFNQSTKISYEIYNNIKHITLTIFDLNGKEVMKLVDERQAQGKNQVAWDGKDSNGIEMPSGVYIYTLHVGEKVFTRKLTLMK